MLNKLHRSFCNKFVGFGGVFFRVCVGMSMDHGFETVKSALSRKNSMHSLTLFFWFLETIQTACRGKNLHFHSIHKQAHIVSLQEG